MHETEVGEGFGVLTAKTKNLLPPANSKTGYIAVLSAIMTLKKMTEPVLVGMVLEGWVKSLKTTGFLYSGAM